MNSSTTWLANFGLGYDATIGVCTPLFKGRTLHIPKLYSGGEGKERLLEEKKELGVIPVTYLLMAAVLKQFI